MSTKTILLAALCGFTICAQGQKGLQGEYFNGRDFEQKVLTRTDPQINFFWNNVPPAPGLDAHVFSVRWTGFIKAPESGTFLFRAYVDDGIRVYVGGKLVIDAWDLHDTGRFVGEIKLRAGQRYPLKVEYFNAMYEGEIKLHWQLPSEEPVFGGFMGYNDHLISNRYFVMPAPKKAPKPKAKAVPPPPKRKVPPSPKTKPQPSPPPPVKTVPKTASIAVDTLEKYIPKNILFEKSKSIMLSASKPELDKLANFLQRHPSYRLVVEGHTDKIGNSAKNLVLSQERAQTVATYLAGKGIAADKITAKGYGDTRPLIIEPENVANPKNRRVEFLIQE